MQWLLAIMQLEPRNLDQSLVAFDDVGANCSNKVFWGWGRKQLEITLGPITLGIDSSPHGVGGV